MFGIAEIISSYKFNGVTKSNHAWVVPIKNSSTKYEVNPSSSAAVEAEAIHSVNCEVQCGAVIMQSIFSQLFTEDIP